MKNSMEDLLNFLDKQIKQKRDTINAYSRQGMDTAYLSGEYDAYLDVKQWIREDERRADSVC